MALPLTVKTETALAYRPQCPPNQDIDRAIGTLQKGGDLRTPIGGIAARRELEATITPTGLEETLEGLESITKMTTQAPNVVLNYRMMT